MPLASAIFLATSNNGPSLPSVTLMNSLKSNSTPSADISLLLAANSAAVSFLCSFIILLSITTIFSISFLRLVKFMSVNLTALTPCLFNPFASFVKSVSLNDVSNEGSINSYKFNSSALKSPFGFSPSLSISLYTTFSEAISLSFIAKLLTSPSLPFAYSAACF